MANISAFTYILTDYEAKKLSERAKTNCFDPVEPPAYARWKMKKVDCNIVYYASGKCVIQGKGASDFIQTSMVDFEVVQTQNKTTGSSPLFNIPTFQPHAGLDESGKGDFFGPLVIACAFVDVQQSETLRLAGLKDCKLLSDSQTMTLARKAVEILGRDHFSIVIIGNEKYNLMYEQFKNLNRLLAWGHARALENVLNTAPHCQHALADQFANPVLIKRALMEKGRLITLEQRTKAESDIAVATASVLARASFLKSLEILSEKTGVKIPKGAGPIVLKTATELLKREQSTEIFNSIAKTHFKTLADVLAQQKFR